MSPIGVPMIAGLGPTELMIILGVLVLLFGAKKLPELARGSGRALRIFKAETKGLLDDDDEKKTDEQKQVDAQIQPVEAQIVEAQIVDDPMEPRRAAPQNPTDSDR